MERCYICNKKFDNKDLIIHNVDNKEIKICLWDTQNLYGIKGYGR